MATGDGTTDRVDLEREDDVIPTNPQSIPCTAQGRSLKSDVWKYIERQKLANGDITTTCKCCKTVFTANSNSAVLDPRFKLEGVEYCYEKLFGETYAKEMIKTLKDSLFELFQNYKGGSQVFSSTIGSSFVDPDDFGGQDSVVGCLGSRNEAFEFQAFLNKRRKVDNEKSELELYLDEKVKNLENVAKESDVLTYWKNNSNRYPCLSSMARDILTIPVSTVPSESAFSMGKKLINPWRSSLSSKTIEALACLEDWLRAKGMTLGPSLFFGYGEEASIDVDDEDDDEVEEDVDI